MRLTVATVGRVRDGPFRTLWDDYAGRLPWALTLREIADAYGPRRREREGEKLLAALPDGSTLVALDERGKTRTSRQLAEWLGHQRDEGDRDIGFVIGGADGLSDAVRSRAFLTLSLGTMTWPHKMARIMLIEQLYRAHTILAGHPYHRD
ncbi:MAG: 23S rRNA (pseudouridine(1915)-N(3))-methyltransferase RlmH [Rhodospirillales bacterium]|nr:23S rRNA (pseudouridine(1915)-N(3))-methyltransferase RlmH [Rhodospirillales bacterium]